MTDTEPSTDVPEHCLGTTGPLSLNKPSESDLKITKELEAALASLNVFESADEMALRRESLLQLQDVCNNWIHDKAVEKKFPPHMASNYAGKVYTFGSYRLGVNTRGADIDALLVVPRFIERSEFFDDFFQILKDNPNVEDLHPVPEAFVPVMKMCFCGVEIDLLFAKVDLLTIPPDFDLCEKTEQLLRNMSDQDVRSVNGVRVTEEILRLVHNKETFKTSLKVIRMWARRRALYSNALGFFGGVTWAILVARICQLFPKAAPSVIVIQFFNVLRQWEWPRPIMLKNTETSSLGFPVWDPRINISDQFHLMPILTPAYPSQNSTYNVSNSSKTVIVREIDNAAPLIKDIMTKKKSWSAIFDEVNFFCYRHYVVVMVTAPEKQQFMELCGLVESKMRILVGNFERSPMVELAHVFCQSFGRAVESDPENIKKWFIGMQFRKMANKRLNVDLSSDIHIFEKSIGRGLHNENLCDFVTVKHVKKSQLNEYLPPEEMAKVIAVQPVRVNRKRVSDTPIETLCNTSEKKAFIHQKEESLETGNGTIENSPDGETPNPSNLENDKTPSGSIKVTQQDDNSSIVPVETQTTGSLSLNQVKKSQLNEYLPPEEMAKVIAVQPVRVNRKRVSDTSIETLCDTSEKKAFIHQKEESLETGDGTIEVSPNGDTPNPSNLENDKTPFGSIKVTQQEDNSSIVPVETQTTGSLSLNQVNSEVSEFLSPPSPLTTHSSQEHLNTVSSSSEFVFSLSTCSSTVSLAAMADEAIDYGTTPVVLSNGSGENSTLSHSPKCVVNESSSQVDHSSEPPTIVETT